MNDPHLTCEALEGMYARIQRGEDPWVAMRASQMMAGHYRWCMGGLIQHTRLGSPLLGDDDPRQQQEAKP